MLKEYFEPIISPRFPELANFDERLGRIVKYTEIDFFPNLEGVDIAIFGICQERKSINIGTALAPQRIREELYRLYYPKNQTTIVDLGDLKVGSSDNDVYYALADVIEILLEKGIIAVILGGKKNLIYGNYLAYERLGYSTNIVSVDPRLEISTNEYFETELPYLSKILLSKNNRLFSFSNLGAQVHYINSKDLALLEKLNYDMVRLGNAKADITLTEPYIRDADIFNVDISCIKQSDAPGHRFASPNGFASEQVCQMAKYAGMSDRLCSFGLYDVNITYDIAGQTAGLAAQIVWYFLDGFNQRRGEFPKSSLETAKKFMVYNENIGGEICFYKSMLTDRWWFEIPQRGKKIEEPLIVSCSYSDYQLAVNQEIPPRYWRLYNQLN